MRLPARLLIASASRRRARRWTKLFGTGWSKTRWWAGRIVMSDELDDLYQQVILDHCKAPRNFKVLEGANRKGEGYNPLCGDNYTVFLKMEGDVVQDASFQGSGCCISKASASLLTAAVKGKTKAEV